MFEYVTEFESQIAEFFGAPYAVATDSCTHALELCLRHTKDDHITIPKRTYVSVPMTCMKLGLNWSWREEEWSDYYYLGGTNITDAAVLWGENTYIPDPQEYDEMMKTDEDRNGYKELQKRKAEEEQKCGSIIECDDFIKEKKSYKNKSNNNWHENRQKIYKDKYKRNKG